MMHSYTSRGMLAKKGVGVSDIGTYATGYSRRKAASGTVADIGIEASGEVDLKDIDNEVVSMSSAFKFLIISSTSEGGLGSYVRDSL